MNRCGNCKFWGRLIKSRRGNPLPDQVGEWRQCGRFIHDDNGYCKPEAEIRLEEDWDANWDQRQLKHPVRMELAVVQDGSGYFAALKCREDFGCVLFEPKETE